jgi:hypothetical protein
MSQSQLAQPSGCNVIFGLCCNKKIKTVVAFFKILLKCAVQVLVQIVPWFNHIQWLIWINNCKDCFCPSFWKIQLYVILMGDIVITLCFQINWWYMVVPACSVWQEPTHHDKKTKMKLITFSHGLFPPPGPYPNQQEEQMQQKSQMTDWVKVLDHSEHPRQLWWPEQICYDDEPGCGGSVACNMTLNRHANATGPCTRLLAD